MFPRMNITTPLPSFAAYYPHSAGAGFGGINPMVPYVTNPYVSSPASTPYPMIAPSPLAVQPGLPYPLGPLSAGINPISPFSAISSLSAISPFSGISPWYSPLSWSPYAFAQASPAIPAIHPALAAAAFSSPVTYIDPATGAPVPQPYPAAQSLLPIRPLVAAAQAIDPVTVAALCGMTPAAMVDPYSVMAHMPAPMPVSSVSPMMRSPLYMSPVGSPTVGLPYPVTAGIPC